MSDQASIVAARQRWMSVLARSQFEDLEAHWPGQADMPEFVFLRAPEPGLVMTRGRVGGTGDAFNLGEMTVTRCSVQLADGTIGHAYVPGRSKAHAQLAAVLDALMQGAHRPYLETTVIDPLEHLLEVKRDIQARKAAATKVDFFTLARSAQPK